MNYKLMCFKFIKWRFQISSNLDLSCLSFPSYSKSLAQSRQRCSSDGLRAKRTTHSSNTVTFWMQFLGCYWLLLFLPFCICFLSSSSFFVEFVVNGERIESNVQRIFHSIYVYVQQVHIFRAISISIGGTNNYCNCGLLFQMKSSILFIYTNCLQLNSNKYMGYNKYNK